MAEVIRVDEMPCTSNAEIWSMVENRRTDQRVGLSFPQHRKGLSADASRRIEGGQKSRLTHRLSCALGHGLNAVLHERINKAAAASM